MAKGYKVANLGIEITSSAQGAVKALNSLTDAIKRANTASNSLHDKFVKLGTVSTALNGVNTSINKIGSGFGKAASDTDKHTKQIRNSVQAMSGTISGFGRSLAYISGFGSLMQSIQTIMRVGSFTFVKAGEFAENYNLFNVSFAGETKEAIRFQYELNQILGTNISETMRYQGFFNNLAGSLGITNDASMVLSENLTKLTYDLSSLFNMPVDLMYSKLQSGIIGQTKPLRSVGIDVTQQTLQPILYEMGIDKLVTELTQAEKVLLRYISILRQSSNAQGDFARSIEAPMNQIRVMKEQFMEMSRWFGAMFIGTFSKALPYINAVVMSLKEIFKWVALLFGFNLEDYDFLPENDLPDIEEDLNSATAASEAFKKSLYGFDELNLATSLSASGGYSPLNTTGLSDTYYQLLEEIEGYDMIMDSVRMKALDIKDTLMTWLGFSQEIDEVTGEIKYKFIGIKDLSFRALADSVKALWEAVKGFTTNSIDLLVRLFEKFIAPIAEVVIEKTLPAIINAITAAIKALSDIYETIKSSLDKFLSEFLVPLTKITLGIINEGLKNLVLIFNDLGSFAKNNPGLAKTLTDISIAIGLFVIGKKVYDALILMNPQMLLLSVAIGAFVYFYDDIKNMWEALSPSEQMLVSLGLLAAGIWGVALAIMGMQSAWTLGVGAIAIVAGISAMTAAVENMKAGVTSSIPNIPTTQMPVYNTPSQNPYTGNWQTTPTPTQTPKTTVTAPKTTVTTKPVVVSQDERLNKYTSVGMYANGGLPKSGEMFISRENGMTEMVGKFGSSSGVANNQQIVEGIKQGVKEAIMETSQNNGGDSNIILQVDELQLGIANIRAINKAGRLNNLVVTAI